MNKKIKLFSLISAPIILGGGFAALTLVNQCTNDRKIDISKLSFSTDLHTISLYDFFDIETVILNDFYQVNSSVILDAFPDFTINDLEVQNMKIRAQEESTADIVGTGSYKGVVTTSFMASPNQEVQNSDYFLYGDTEADNYDPENPVKINNNTIYCATEANELKIQPGKLIDPASGYYLPDNCYEMEFSSSDETIAQIIKTDDDTYQIITCEKTGIVNLGVTFFNFDSEGEKVILWHGTSCVNVTGVNNSNNFFYNLDFGHLDIESKPINWWYNWFKDFGLWRNGINVISECYGVNYGGKYGSQSTPHFRLYWDKMDSQGDWTNDIDYHTESGFVRIYSGYIYVNYAYGLNGLHSKFEGQLDFHLNISFSYTA